MARLLVVHHTTSPPTHALLLATLEGARDPSIQGVEVVTEAALSANASQVLAADGYLIASPVNLGYLAGAVKHFFDQIYYPCIEETKGRPYAAWVHGNNDTSGALRAIETITTGLQWKKAQPLLSLIGEPSQEDLAKCRELGASVAATLSISE
jgi:multimeric flavodoxin WrbA